MHKYIKPVFAFLFAMLFAHAFVSGQIVYKVDLKEEIGPNAWRTINQAYTKALENKSNIFLIELNTFGGAVNFADSIRSRLLDATMKTIVYVNNNAASAGALISLASDEIYMHKGGSIGAASVVDQSGEIMPEKYQSYMRGLMRATAEAKGRDPKIAEAFVDAEVSIPNLKPDGKLLTLTSGEALAAGIIKAEVNGIDEVYQRASVSKQNVIEHQVTTIDRIISMLINPLVSGLLILGIIGGIYFELQTPGIGFAFIVALICGSLFFAPLYLQGLADNWEIAIFLIGVLCLVLEVFVIPGFGVAGILGIICVLCGLAFSMVDNDFLNFKLSTPGLLINSFLIVSGAMVLSVVLMVIFGKNILRSRAFKRLVLQDEQQSDVGFTSSPQKAELINQIGVARTVLRPGGKIEVAGVWYDAIALDGFIDPGEEIYVVKHENYNLFVRRRADMPVS
ncbi:MAG: NfeD family protein [Sphingobacterium sp.]|uniref:NfeD family protein n=1 Tax=Sphingobacterium sp. JB170 TaxID=1434842 RepID=UPI00097F295C|nr:NfeD family protein [Sphingobacterium sp. JB170]SJN38940.1 Putative membrane-bound ClpP-class protease associated with aq_911 [Sphingobacterium sp. JB170]